MKYALFALLFASWSLGLTAQSSTEMPVELERSCMTGKNVCDPLEEAVAASMEGFAQAKGVKLFGGEGEDQIYFSRIDFPGGKNVFIAQAANAGAVLTVTYMDPLDDQYDLHSSYVDLVELVRGCIRLAGYEFQTDEETDPAAEWTFRLVNPNYPKDNTEQQLDHGMMIMVMKLGDSLVLSFG